MLLDEQREVLLARGLIDSSGARHPRVLLRALNGRQEAALAGGASAQRSALMDEVLAACIQRIGGYQQVGSEHTAALSRGDRKRLLLELQRLMFGDRFWVSLACANPDCGEWADIQLDVAEILQADSLQPEPSPQPEYFEVDTPSGRARLRAPSGLDDAAREAAQSSGEYDRERLSALLWSRLLLSLGEQAKIDADDWLALPAETRQRIALALSEGDEELSGLSVLSRCPSCNAWMELQLDPMDLLQRELRVGSQRLLAEIHSLAFHYGWSEQQILDLPRGRRWAYLELIANQIQGRPLVGFGAGA